MDSLKELLIPTVNAQSGVDSLAQPTFGIVDLQGGSTSTGSVLISVDKTNVNVGDTITATIAINTNEISIEEYRISLGFDPTKFSVVDADSATEGTQVTLLDPIFSIENPSTDNTVSSQGRVRVIAKVDSRLAVNRDVIEIKLQAQSGGNTAIEVINSGELPTELVREAGVGLSYTPNSVTIGINTTQTIPDPGTNPGTDGGIVTPTNPTTPQIPDTSIEEFLPAILPILGGILLLVLGISLSRGGKSRDKYS